MITRPYPRLNGLKTIPFPVAHTRIANIWEYPPPQCTVHYLSCTCRFLYLVIPGQPAGNMTNVHASCIDSKSPAFGWRLQLSDSIFSSPAEQAKSPAKLGLTNFVKHVSRKLLFHKCKTVHDLRSCEIDEKLAAN